MTKIKSTKELCEKALAPLVEYCAHNRGALTRVCEIYNKGLADPVRVTTFQRWVCKDPDKRVEPYGGSLLRLIEVWHDLQKTIV